MKFKLNVLTIIIGILVSVNAFFIFSSSSPKEATNSSKPIFNTSQAYILPVSETSYIPILNSGSIKPAIDGKSAVVYNLRSGKNLYVKNSDQRLPIASVTKLMTAVIVSENYNPKDIVTIEKNSIKVDGQRQDLYEGEQIRVGELMKMMLVESSNDAAYALANYASQSGSFDFISAMNGKAEELGMDNTHYLDPAGLDDNAYSSASDLVKLIRYSLRYDSIWSLTREKELTATSADGKIIHHVQNTDQLLGIVPNIIGGKTGFTDGALGCLVLIVDLPDKNDRLISIVLGSNDRFGDTQRIVNWVTTAYRWE